MGFWYIILDLFCATQTREFFTSVEFTNDTKSSDYFSRWNSDINRYDNLLWLHGRNFQCLVLGLYYRGCVVTFGKPDY